MHFEFLTHIVICYHCLRNVFYKKVKTRPQTPSIARQYIISKSMFEFGPLLMNKDPKGERRGAVI